MTNAILAAAENALPDVAEGLYCELSQLLGTHPDRPRPQALALAFGNRIVALQMNEETDRVVDELLEAVTRERESPDWLAVVTQHAPEVVGKNWTQGSRRQHERLSKLLHHLWEDPEARASLRARMDGGLLQRPCQVNRVVLKVADDFKKPLSLPPVPD